MTCPAEYFLLPCVHHLLPHILCESTTTTTTTTNNNNNYYYYYYYYVRSTKFCFYMYVYLFYIFIRLMLLRLCSQHYLILVMNPVTYNNNNNTYIPNGRTKCVSTYNCKRKALDLHNSNDCPKKPNGRKEGVMRFYF